MYRNEETVPVQEPERLRDSLSAPVENPGPRSGLRSPICAGGSEARRERGEARRGAAAAGECPWQAAQDLGEERQQPKCLTAQKSQTVWSGATHTISSACSLSSAVKLCNAAQSPSSATSQPSPPLALPPPLPCPSVTPPVLVRGGGGREGEEKSP